MLLTVAACWTSATASTPEAAMRASPPPAEGRGRNCEWRGGGYNLLWSKAAIERATTKGPPAHCEQGDLGHAAQEHEGAPSKFSVITANIHSLGNRAEEVMGWDADVVLLQETKLTAHAIKDDHGPRQALSTWRDWRGPQEGQDECRHGGEQRRSGGPRQRTEETYRTLL